MSNSGTSRKLKICNINSSGIVVRERNPPGTHGGVPDLEIATIAIGKINERVSAI